MTIWVLLSVISSLVALGSFQSTDIDEDAHLRTLGLIAKYNYQGEEHTVITDDGYILTIHRILPKTPNTEGKSPILLQHGLLCSSADWVLLGPQQSLGYILADAGYDVWLGNNRGNKYGRAHVDPDCDPDKNPDNFWKFSWHEMGVSDLPAMIDYVLNATGNSSLYYSGHSQGTTQFFVMGSEKPEYNSKIKLMTAFAPIAFMGKAKSPVITWLSPFVDELAAVADLIGLDEFWPNTDLLAALGENVCKEESIFQPICSNVLFLMCGFDSPELNVTSLPIIMGHTPAGAATRQMVHYAQNKNHEKHFRQYDFLLGNLAKYGQLTPPDYKLDKITAPVSLFVSGNDWFSNLSDVEKLKELLPNLVYEYHVIPKTDTEFNHLDYLYAIHAPECVYAQYLDLLSQYP